MTSRFILPDAGTSTSVRFPPVVRDALGNGLQVWAIPQQAVPVMTALLVIRHGTSDDPPDKPGLASLTADLVDEGAGVRDAIALADAFGRLGAQLEIDVGPDATSIAVTALTRFLDPLLDLLADVVMRPRLADPDFERVRDLRMSRLKQLSRSAGTMADRAYIAALFGDHPYGHGALGTTASLSALRASDARELWQAMYCPRGSTLIVAGAVEANQVTASAARAFGDWTGERPADPLAPPEASAMGRVLLIDRPGSPQSELRVGHVGPPRTTPSYHALVTLNALVGGQFTSRINRRLREEKGVTYGARTSFDFRRVAGTFSCETSVQSDATAMAVTDILREFDGIRHEGAISADELSRAKGSLTRGYVRHFEAAGQLARAAAQLVTYSLDADTFDRFVPGVDAITSDDVLEAAQHFVRPEIATVVVVGDRAVCRQALDASGRPAEDVTVEF